MLHICSGLVHLRKPHALVYREAADYQDVVVLPYTWESYFNITHQTLEMCRMAAIDPSITHLMKVDDDSYVHMARLLTKIKKLPREKLFLGHMEKAGVLHLSPGSTAFGRGAGASDIMTLRQAAKRGHVNDNIIRTPWADTVISSRTTCLSLEVMP